MKLGSVSLARRMVSSEPGGFVRSNFGSKNVYGVRADLDVPRAVVALLRADGLVAVLRLDVPREAVGRLVVVVVGVDDRVVESGREGCRHHHVTSPGAGVPGAMAMQNDATTSATMALVNLPE